MPKISYTYILKALHKNDIYKDYYVYTFRKVKVMKIMNVVGFDFTPATLMIEVSGKPTMKFDGLAIFSIHGYHYKEGV